jgi:5S rRNA maturation endonuclease (ribonuclease M5)
MAGCATEVVLKAMGLEWKDIMGEREEKRIIATYQYTDAEGKLLFEVVRYEPKSFVQRRPDGAGGWIWNLEGVQRVLYRLPRVIEAVKTEQPVVFVEGEKDVQTAERLGFVATTLAGGANARWEEQYSEVLRGAIVYIIPDCDKPGREHAAKVAENLRGVAKSVKMVFLPQGKDLTEWVERGGDAEKLKQLLDTAEEYEGKREEEIYFYPRSGKYIRKDACGRWIEVNESQIKKHIAMVQGIVDKNELADFVYRIQHHNAISWLGKIAGRRRGMYEELGERLLVTEERKHIPPRRGNWDILKKFLDGMLEDEVDYFHAWVWQSLYCLEHEYFRPAPVMVLAGPADCGKSLTIKLLTQLFGGRSANIYAWMTKRTQFNEDMCGAELLVVDDEQSGISTERKYVATILKQIASQEVLRIEGKYKTPVMVRGIWRLVIALNDSPEYLSVLPALDDTTKDKVFLLRCHRKEMPMPTRTLDELRAFWDALMQCLPGYAWWLFNEFSVPSEIRGGRFGIKAWQDESLLKALHETSAEAQTWEYIQRALFSDDGALSSTEWEGTVSELYHVLSEKLKYEWRQQVPRVSQLAYHLRKLRKIYPSKVDWKHTHSNHLWIVKKAEIDENDEHVEHEIEVEPPF